MSKEEIINKVYEKYFNTYPDAEKTFQYEGSTIETRRMTKDEFVDMIKTDTEFSERWGLKIEEKELSRDERIDLYCEEHTPGIRGKYVPPFDDFIDAKLKTWNIPNKLITITYNNERIESYE